MAETETKLPAKAEKKIPAAREDIWSPLEYLRREIERLFDDFHPAAWRFPFSRSRFGFEMPSPRSASTQPRLVTPQRSRSRAPGHDEAARRRRVCAS